MKLCLSIDQVTDFLNDAFPEEVRSSLGRIESLAANHIRMSLTPVPAMIRPGGIVSGPTQMMLADVAAYALIAAHHGPEPMVVTNALSINFLRACRMETLFADARFLKLGRRLATVDVRIWQGTEDRLVAQATVGYALP